MPEASPVGSIPPRHCRSAPSPPNSSSNNTETSSRARHFPRRWHRLCWPLRSEASTATVTAGIIDGSSMSMSALLYDRAAWRCQHHHSTPGASMKDFATASRAAIVRYFRPAKAESPPSGTQGNKRPISIKEAMKTKGISLPHGIYVPRLCGIS